MKSFFTASLLAASAMAMQLSADVADDSWTTVSVSPPADGCCTKQWKSGCQNTIKNALNKVSGPTILELQPGTYCNYQWKSTTHKYAKDFRHQPIAKISKKSDIQITAADTSDMPKLVFDGIAAFTITKSSNLSFSYLELVGPALDITGEEASENHARRTGRDEGGCGQYTQAQC